jgi:hypothetical protein
MVARFKPWIGTKYRQSPVRILLLGEAHYGKGVHDTAYTIRLVAKHQGSEVAKPKGVRFLSKASALIAGDRLRPSLRAGFWDDLAYCNFVGDFAAETAGKAPSKKQLRDGAARYPDLLRDIKPHIIFVCGFRLWSAMECYLSFDRLPKKREYRTGSIRGRPHFGCMHPSTSVEHAVWGRSFLEFVEDQNLGEKFKNMQANWTRT